MQRYQCLICFTNLLSILLVDSARPTYDFSREDPRTFRGTNAFGKSTKAVLATKTFQGPSFLMSADDCQEEKAIIEEVFQKLGLQKPQGSYCTWPGVQCQDCRITELRFNLQQRQEVSGQLRSLLGDLTHLQLLDLGGATQLSGDLEMLRNATELRELNLSHSQVQGDIRVFKHMKLLRVLDLEGTLVEGSLGAFRNTSQLEVLRMSGTCGKIFGDLSVFTSKNLKKLKVLRLNATAVTAKAKVLSRFTRNLEELRLENAINVDWKMDRIKREFQRLIRLQKVMLTNTNLRGTIFLSDLQKNMQEICIEHSANLTVELPGNFRRPWLRRLILRGVQMLGTTNAFRQLPRLNELHLEPLKPALSDPWLARKGLGSLKGTNLVGDIGFVLGTPKLQELSLKGTNLRGDMQVLPHLPELEVLSLTGHDVTGDVEVLEKLPKLKSINLAKTKVHGSIKSLKDLKVEVLNLAATNVSGTIEALFVKKLQELCLSDTVVQGNISVLRNSLGLRKLDLFNSKVVGDLQVFQSTTQLEELRAWSTSIHGDIQVLRHLPELKQVSMSMTSVHGDLGALSHAAKLEIVRFSNTQVEGNISALQRAQELQEAFFAGTQVYGDIGVFRRMTKLIWLNFARTQVSGNINAFAGARELQWVSFEGTQIHGSLEAFQLAQKLQRLKLAGLQIRGDLQIFSKMKKLVDLKLTKCDVTGNISAFADAEDLERLRLSRTSVFGTLQSLTRKHKLRRLSMAGTGITGELSDLKWIPDLESIDLSQTQVTCKVSADWNGHFKRLRTLELSDSRATVIPDEDVLQSILNEGMAILPALTGLRVSRCPLNGTLQNLFQLVSASKTLSTISASGCGLTGNLSDLTSIRRWDPSTYSFDALHLRFSLLELDISKNHFEEVEGLPMHARVRLSDNAGQLHFAKGVLAKAFEDNLELDLRNTKLRDPNEAEERLNAGTLNMTSGFALTNDEKGYGCLSFDPQTTNVHIISGETFLPDRMCKCLEGWHGSGINCTECGNGTYSDDKNAKACKACPGDGYTEVIGATSVRSCKCKIGKLIRNNSACGCSKFEALLNDSCVNCLERNRNLNCSSEGLNASTAPPLDGFARLEDGATQSYKCFKPKDRCNHSDFAGQKCGKGYEGYLCMDCSRDYFASSGECWRCDASQKAEAWRWWIAISLGAAAVAGLVIAGCFYDKVMATFQAVSSLEVAAEMKQSVPLLLQCSQLWAVLSTLPSSQREASEHFRSLADWEVQLPELPYIRGVRFSPVDVQGTLNFQCVMDGADARYWVAVLAPMMPLIFLLVCGILEMSRQGSGISKALLVLSIFFVGGASSCSKLVSCKRYDAGGTSLGKFAFQESLPSFKCSELSPEVSAVFYVTSMCYLFLIPGFLLYLFAKQHFALRSNKLLVSCSKAEKVQELSFEQIPLKEEVLLAEKKDDMLERRLVAGAVAYAAVFVNNEAQIRVKDSAVTVKNSAERTSDAYQFQTSQFFESEPSWMEAVEPKDQRDAFRCRAITEMLMERCVLFERCELAELKDRDRVLSGARDMLMKYAVCQNVWMEILLKLVTISLVSVVQNPHDGLKMSLAVTLVMAALVALMRPYAQAQVNNLQCSCFISLAVAAVSFSFRVPWLSRVSLALPFLVALAQAGLPESAEARASKIWQELERKLKDPSKVKGQPITVSTKTLTVSITIHERGPK